MAREPRPDENLNVSALTPTTTTKKISGSMNRDSGRDLIRGSNVRLRDSISVESSNGVPRAFGLLPTIEEFRFQVAWD